MEAESQEDVNGDWVKYEDYAALHKKWMETHERANEMAIERNTALLAAIIWRPIETATWDVLSKNDRVVLNGWNANVRFAYVVDFNGKVDFEDEYGVPLIAEFDGYTHWMPLPKPPSV